MREDLNRVERWDRRLKTVFDEIDARLEENAAVGKGLGYQRHPVRMPAGVTSNPEDDGLFEVGASFTAGIGSERGPGYVLTARIATLEDVEPGVQERLEAEIVRMLREKLPKAFPGKDLEVVKDGGAWKIVGDLGLD